MKTLISTLTLWLFSLILAAQPQVSAETAKKILGDHFISSYQAVTAWQAIDPTLVLHDSITIPYDVSTLEYFQAKTRRGEGDFWLVPALGLGDNALRKFWGNYYGVYNFPIRTEVTYRLVNLKPPVNTNSVGFSELGVQMRKENGQTMSAMDYLETIATVYLATGNNFSSQFCRLMLSEDKTVFGRLGPLQNFKGDLTLAYSTLIVGNCHEVVISYFPKENFVGGSISPLRLTFLATEDDQTENMIMVPLKNISCLQEERDYLVGICYYIKPWMFNDHQAP